MTLVSDSKYVIDALSLGWAEKWKCRGWKRSSGDDALNPDLWDILLALTKKHTLTYKWVKGHAGHEYNERCDAIAQNEADNAH